jgi:hypoxanthine-guanine phosphoribosyltransferase
VLADKRKQEIMIEVTDILVESKGKRFSEMAEILAAKYSGEELFLAGFISGAFSIVNDMHDKGMNVPNVLNKLMGKGGTWE